MAEELSAETVSHGLKKMTYQLAIERALVDFLFLRLRAEGILSQSDIDAVADGFLTFDAPAQREDSELLRMIAEERFKNLKGRGATEGNV